MQGGVTRLAHLGESLLPTAQITRIPHRNTRHLGVPVGQMTGPYRGGARARCGPAPLGRSSELAALPRTDADAALRGPTEAAGRARDAADATPLSG